MLYFNLIFSYVAKQQAKKKSSETYDSTNTSFS